MDLTGVVALRALLASTGWVERTHRFGRALRGAGHEPGRLLVVGTPDEEPWHLTTHLADEARWAASPELAPTLLRRAPPPGAPPHLSVGLQRLEQARRGETVFVVVPDAAPAESLENAGHGLRVARRRLTRRAG